MKYRIRILCLLGFVFLVVGVLSLKAGQEGWFANPSPLELDSQPVLLFFTLSDGCVCQMKIIGSAASQIAFWEPPNHPDINIMWIYFDQEPEIVKYYHVERAPTIVLLDSDGEVYWMQGELQLEGQPFDMAEIEEQVESLLAREGR